MDQKKKNRKWLAAAVGAAAVVFLVLAANERTPSAPATQPTSSETILTSGGDGAEESPPSEGTSEPTTADRKVVVAELSDLIAELGIEPEELDGGDAADGGGDGGGARGGGEDDAEAAEPATITIEEGAKTGGASAFGDPVTVSPGETVEVVNNDSVPHNITSPEGFKTPDIAPGGTATFTAPEEPGTYNFNCGIHPAMTGSLEVEDSAGAEKGQERKSGSATSEGAGGSDGGAGHGGGSGGASHGGAGTGAESETRAQTPTSAGSGY
jgi:plastocyanin